MTFDSDNRDYEMEQCLDEIKSLKTTIRAKDEEIAKRDTQMSMITDLQAENEKLNKIMPHDNETCKHIKPGVHLGDWSTCSLDSGYICDDNRGCINNKWELKEALQEKQAGDKKDFCVWTEEMDGDCWDSSCGESFVLIEGTPKENDFKFCAYCGKEIQEKPDGK